MARQLYGSLCESDDSRTTSLPRLAGAMGESACERQRAPSGTPTRVFRLANFRTGERTEVVVQV